MALNYYIVYGEDGGALYQVQSFETKKAVAEWENGGFRLRCITSKEATKLAKTYRLNSLYDGRVTQSGGDEPYIPETLPIGPSPARRGKAKKD